MKNSWLLLLFVCLFLATSCGKSIVEESEKDDTVQPVTPPDDGGDDDDGSGGSDDGGSGGSDDGGSGGEYGGGSGDGGSGEGGSGGGNDDGGFLFLAIRFQQILHRQLRSRVEEVERLIQNQQFRIMQHGTNDAHFLLVTHGQVANQRLLSQYLTIHETVRMVSLRLANTHPFMKPSKSNRRSCSTASEMPEILAMNRNYSSGVR